jgi:hypothetical protein
MGTGSWAVLKGGRRGDGEGNYEFGIMNYEL